MNYKKIFFGDRKSNSGKKTSEEKWTKYGDKICVSNRIIKNE